MQAFPYLIANRAEFVLSSYRPTKMHLLPRERDKLYVREIGLLAQTRLARGIRLNETEAIALISAVLQEMARSGKYTVASVSYTHLTLPTILLV